MLSGCEYAFLLYNLVSFNGHLAIYIYLASKAKVVPNRQLLYVLIIYNKY